MLLLESSGGFVRKGRTWLLVEFFLLQGMFSVRDLLVHWFGRWSDWIAYSVLPVLAGVCRSEAPSSPCYSGKTTSPLHLVPSPLPWDQSTCREGKERSGRTDCASYASCQWRLRIPREETWIARGCTRWQCSLLPVGAWARAPRNSPCRQEDLNPRIVDSSPKLALSTRLIGAVPSGETKEWISCCQCRL